MVIKRQLTHMQHHLDFILQHGLPQGQNNYHVEPENVTTMPNVKPLLEDMQHTVDKWQASENRRTSSETIRQIAEEARASAEAARKIAEHAREVAETTRLELFEKLKDLLK